MSGARITWALFAGTWIALALALAGAISTPRNYCYYEGAAMPAAVILAYVGLGVAVVLQFAGIVAASLRESSTREGIAYMSLVGLALSAGVAVAALMQHHVASWGCG